MAEDKTTALITYVPQFISFLTGFLTAIFAEPIRKMLFKPELIACFENTDDFKTLTPEGNRSEQIHQMQKSYYLRIKITNIKKYLAENCKAFLVDIQKLDENDILIPTAYCDSIPLAWSCQKEGEQFNGISINFKSTNFVDVITTRENHSQYWPQIKVTPLRYASIFSEHGKYVFTIQITSSNAEPIEIKLLFEWNGQWDKFRIKKI